MAENLPDTNVGNIEYISKQDASDWLKQYGQDVLHGKYKFSLMYIWKNLMDLPSADVVLVVRCKDCKHNANPPEAGNADCDLFYGMTEQYGFCHRAERRTDG